MKFQLQLCIIVLTCLLSHAHGQEAKNPAETRPEFKIEVFEKSFRELIDPSQKIEVLAEGFRWSEGPVWHKTKKVLLFSDVPANKIYQLVDGELSVFMDPSGFDGESKEKGNGSNGLAFDSQGRLTVCDHGNRRIYRVEEDGKTKTTLADKFEGKRFNSPNDLVFKSNGDIFFTDPPYGLNDESKHELGYSGVFCLKPDGKVERVSKELTRPNGIGLSPDEKTIYVAQSHKPNPIYTKYKILDDGSYSAGEVLFDARKLAEKDRGPLDGLKVDIQGNLWATGPGGVLVISPQGKLLGRIYTGTPAANCNFVGDGSKLIMTAGKFIIQVQTQTKGLGDWGDANPTTSIPIDVVNEVSATIDAARTMLDNGEHEKFFMEAVPAKVVADMKANGRLKEVLEMFKTEKVPRILRDLNSAYFTCAEYDPSNESLKFFNDEKSFGLRKVNGQWQFQN